MSKTLLFEIGAVIFLVVGTAVFIYGMAIFRDWQDRDAMGADVRHQDDDTEHLSSESAKDSTARQSAPLHRIATDRRDEVPRPSVA